MAIHLNPFRLFRGRLCMDHGLLVEILRNTQVFWEAYQLLLELNKKRQSDVEELRFTMAKMGLNPRDINVSEKKKAKIIKNIESDFKNSLEKIEGMLESLHIIVLNDETFLYRVVYQLLKIHAHIQNIDNLPDHIKTELANRVYELMKHLEEKQHHAWVVSKAHSRGFSKFEELTILSNRAERRKIRTQTLEIDHLRSLIEPLSEKIEHIRQVRNHDDIHRLHFEIIEMLHMYHEQMNDISSILEEADILIRRSENLFKAIEKEAHNLGTKNMAQLVEKYDKKFHDLLKGIENQARREYLDIQVILKDKKMHTLHKPKTHHADLRLKAAA